MLIRCFVETVRVAESASRRVEDSQPTAGPETTIQTFIDIYTPVPYNNMKI